MVAKDPCVLIVGEIFSRSVDKETRRVPMPPPIGESASVTDQGPQGCSWKGQTEAEDSAEGYALWPFVVQRSRLPDDL